MAITRERISKETLKTIQQKVILEKRVDEFITNAKIPRSAYYTALLGGRIKSVHHEKIVETLKQY